jgi:predicted DNA-binding protein (MmcQ/YjbR family)
MAKKKAATKASKPKSFAGMIRGRSPSVRSIAKALRDLVYEELTDVQESFYGGQLPMSMYRTNADVCWIQLLKERCNLYFMRGPELTDRDHILAGKSDRCRFAKVGSLDDVEQLPLRAWLQESVALNEAATRHGMNFDQVLEKLKTICLALPKTKQTLTWGKPHFRVGEKIFCGCGEDKGSPRVGLKTEKHEAELMMRLPGIEQAPYSRKGTGWVTIDPGVFDDWDEIERLIVGSYRLIAPKRTVSLLDSTQQRSKTASPRKPARRSK